MKRRRAYGAPKKRMNNILDGCAARLHFAAP